MSYTGGYNLPSPIPQGVTPPGALPPPQGSPPPWFGSPVAGGQGNPFQQRVQPMQQHPMQQAQPAPQPQAQQQAQQTPYQRMMQGNGLQNFMNNTMGVNAPQQLPGANGGQQQSPMIRPNSLIGQVGALVNGNTGGLNPNSLAGKFAGMFGGGGSLNGQTPQSSTPQGGMPAQPGYDPSTFQGIY